MKICPSIPELVANLGLMYHQTGKYPEAIDTFRKANRLKPSLFAPNLFLGLDYLELRRGKEAIPFLEKAESLNPSDVQAPLALGRAPSVGDGGRASDAYRRAIQLEPENADAWFRLGLTYLEQIETNGQLLNGKYKDSAYLRVVAAESFAEQNKLVQSAEAFESALHSSSVPPGAHARYGFVLLRQHLLPQASAELAAELKLNPGSGLAKLGQVRLKFEQSSDSDGVSELLAIWRADEGFVRENFSLLRDGMPLERSMEFEQFVAARQAAGEVPERLIEGLRMSGQTEGVSIKQPSPGADNSNTKSSLTAGASAFALYAAGKYRECSDTLRPRVKLLSRKDLEVLAPFAYFTGDYNAAWLAGRRLGAEPATHLAGLYWQTKAAQKLAVSALDRAGEIDSNSPNMHVLLGDIYRHRQSFNSATEEYRKALALSPNDTGALLGLASCQFMEQKLDESLATSQAALQNKPNDPDINLLVGEILVSRHEYAEAEISLKKGPRSQTGISCAGSRVARTSLCRE